MIDFEKAILFHNHRISWTTNFHVTYHLVYLRYIRTKILKLWDDKLILERFIDKPCVLCKNRSKCTSIQRHDWNVSKTVGFHIVQHFHHIGKTGICTTNSCSLQLLIEKEFKLIELNWQGEMTILLQFRVFITSKNSPIDIFPSSQRQ